MPLDISFIHSIFQEIPIITHQERTLQPRDAFEDNCFQAKIKNCQILKRIARSHLFTAL